MLNKCVRQRGEIVSFFFLFHNSELADGVLMGLCLLMNGNEVQCVPHNSDIFSQEPKLPSYNTIPHIPR